MASIDSLKDRNGHISRENILKILPYGKEFLFLDEIVSLDKQRIVARRKVNTVEEYMNAHFTSFPLMPGALVIESIGQAASVLIRYASKNHEKTHVLAYQIKDAKFYAPVLPKQEMVVEAVSRAFHNNKRMVEGTAQVNGKVVAEVVFILAIIDKEEFEKKYS